MTRVLVLDTNIWLGIIEKCEFELLNNLFYGIEQQYIDLLLPEPVKIEFDKKYRNVLDATLQKRRDVSSRDLDLIVEDILRLFGSAKLLETNENGIVEWVNSGRAPNQNSNNYEDTIVLNTLLNIDKGTHIYLVSKDSDYRVEKNTYEIHPDIPEKFDKKSLKITLSYNLNKTLYEMGVRNTNTKELGEYELYNWRSFRSQVKNKEILKQLEEAVEYYYKELNFIPLSYLSKIFPFKTNDYPSTYFYGNALITDNEDLFIFFQNALKQYKTRAAKINETFFDSESDVRTFKKILKKFNGNMFFTIKYGGKEISIEIENEQPEAPCPCMECTLRRGEVKALMSKIKNNLGESPKDLLQKAYYHYQLQNFHAALLETKKILDTVDKINYPIVYGIAQENIYILEKMLLSGNEEFQNERLKIKIQNENQLLGQGINSMVGYLRYSKFFDYKFFDLIEDFEKVKDRYKSHQGLRNSFYSNIDQLNVQRWSEVLNVIRRNGLFFDYYVNISRFAKITLKLNIYASKDRVVRSWISDFVLRTTLPYLTIKDYKECFKEVDIVELNIGADGIKNIFQLFSAQLNNYPDVSELGEEHPYLKYFIEELNKIGFLLGYIPFSKRQSNQIISKLLDIRVLTSKFDKPIENILDSVIKNRIESINKKNAVQYIKYELEKKFEPSTHLGNVFRLLKKFRTIPLSQVHLDLLLSDDIGEKTHYYRSYILHQLYFIGDGNVKDKVIKAVHNSLMDKDGFDHRVFEVFYAEKIIKFSKDYFNTFIGLVEQEFKKETPLYSHFNRANGEIENLDILNSLINLTYLHFEKPYSQLKRFLGRSGYYDFLIQPEAIDSDKFDIHWFYCGYIKSKAAIIKIMENHDKVHAIVTEKMIDSNNLNYLKAYANVIKFIGV